MDLHGWRGFAHNTIGLRYLVREIHGICGSAFPHRGDSEVTLGTPAPEPPVQSGEATVHAGFALSLWQLWFLALFPLPFRFQRNCSAVSVMMRRGREEIN